MKTLLLAAALLVGANFVYAQDEETPEKVRETTNYFGLTGGVALPVGDFYSKSIKNDHAGYANTGFNLALISRFGLTNSFGIGGKFYYARNYVNKDFYEDTVKLNISPWTYYAFLIGPSFNDPISPSFNINYKFFIGGGIANSPKAKAGEEVLLPAYYSDIQLTWSVSAELQYLFSKDKNWALVGEIGYVDMKPKFQADDESYKQAIKSVQCNLGLAYRLK